MLKWVLALLLFIATPAFAGSTAEQVVPGTNQTTSPFFTQYSSTNKLPIAVYDSGNHSGYCYTSNGSASPATFQSCGGGGGSVSITAGSSNIVVSPSPITGTGTVDLGAAITPATSVTSPLVIGNTTAAGTLTLESTSGVGATDKILFKTGSQTQAMQINTAGIVSIGTTTATASTVLDVVGHTVLEGVTSTGATGTGNLVYSASPTLVTPVLGVAAATSLTTTATVDVGTTGIGSSSLNINGNLAIGTSYLSTAAPTNGAIIQGNVGIGTTSPASKLTLAGGNFITPSADSTSAIGFASNAAPTTPILNIDTTNGRVGIGTTNPIVSLDVNGALRVKDPSTGVYFAFSEIAETNRVKVYSSEPTIRFLNSDDDYANLGVGSLSIGAGNGATAAPLNGIIVQGNVGIGTTTPASTLDVAGGVAIGTSYAGVTAAPTNGLAVQGRVGIGTTSSLVPLTVAGAITYNRTVTAETSSYQLLTSDTNADFTNTGASGSVTFTAPASPNIGETHCFYSTAAYAIVVAANTGQTICNATSVSASAGNFTSNAAIGTNICIEYLVTNGWWVPPGQISGTWTVN